MIDLDALRVTRRLSWSRHPREPGPPESLLLDPLQPRRPLSGSSTPTSRPAANQTAPSRPGSLPRRSRSSTRAWAERLWRRWGRRCWTQEQVFQRPTGSRGRPPRRRLSRPRPFRASSQVVGRSRGPDPPTARHDQVLKDSRTALVAEVDPDGQGSSRPGDHPEAVQPEEDAGNAAQPGPTFEGRPGPGRRASISRVGDCRRPRTWPTSSRRGWGPLGAMAAPARSYLVHDQGRAFDHAPATTPRLVLPLSSPELDAGSRSLRLTLALARLLRVLHERSISDRDLKSANILIVGDPEAEEIGARRLIDLVGVQLLHPLPWPAAGSRTWRGSRSAWPTSPAGPGPTPSGSSGLICPGGSRPAGTTGRGLWRKVSPSHRL